MEAMTFVVPCLFGLEGLAAEELRRLGLEQVLREGDFAQKRYEKFRGMGAPRSRREAP